jgi:CheY-like chemotaxis protein
MTDDKKSKKNSDSNLFKDNDPEENLPDIEKDEGNAEKTEEMLKYEEETKKYAVWRGIVTEGFKKWAQGQKIYDREKERISLYVPENTKAEWQDFIKRSNYSTISKLIREAVNYFIEEKSKLGGNNLSKMDKKTLTNISHALKEPLTSIKGFSQLLIENYKDQLNEEVMTTIQNIFDSSIKLEKKIINILEDIKEVSEKYDILLIEDDMATIRLLTTYFDNKGYICKGVISGTRGIEELRVSKPKLILLDIILPDLNGYDLCKMIKTDKKLKDIPVYLLTAIPSSEVEKNLKETRANGYILKPFDFSDFEILFHYL